MHSQEPGVPRSPRRCPDKRELALRAYLTRLSDNIDATTLCATLDLMICETRAAICRQRGLIALEKLDRRVTAGRTDKLRALNKVQDQLQAARDAIFDDDVAPQVIGRPSMIVEPKLAVTADQSSSGDLKV